MNLIFLALAVIFETAGALFMKASDGLSKTSGIIMMYIFFTASVSCLAVATKKMEVGQGYAIWSGTGIALITVFGIILFKESISVMKLICIGLIILGVIGLHLKQ